MTETNSRQGKSNELCAAYVARLRGPNAKPTLLERITRTGRCANWVYVCNDETHLLGKKRFKELQDLNNGKRPAPDSGNAAELVSLSCRIKDFEDPSYQPAINISWRQGADKRCHSEPAGLWIPSTPPMPKPLPSE